MESEGEVATAFTMARILSNIPLSRGGPTSLVMYDIHALQVNHRLKFSVMFVRSGAVLFRRCGFAVV